MPTITIQPGNTLSGLASKHGTSVQELMNLNPQIKDPDKIRAGASLNIPTEPTAPAGGLKGTLVGKELPTEAPSKLGNFRLALREALNEAAVRRQEGRFEQIKPLLKGAAPGSFKGITSLIREGIKTPVETIFTDIIEARERELELGELEVETIGGFEILRNPRTGEVVSTRVTRSRDEDLSLTEKRAALEANISQYMNNLVGEDGFVAPETYIEAKNRWVKGGGTLTSFRQKFPPELYLTEGSQATIPASLREEEEGGGISNEDIVTGGPGI